MFKRISDVFFSVTLLLVLFPLLLMLALVVRCVMGGPIFFRQRRTGLKGKAFQMIKFRTMSGGD